MIGTTRAKGALAGVAAAMPLLAWLHGFTVDDALIPARYAAHLARGDGYRFSVPGPVTDGVTPLGWPLLLAPFATDTLAALDAARALGAVAWLTAAACLGAAVARLPGSPRRWVALLLVLASGPLAAWSVAGLETGVAASLAAVAACLAAGPRASLAGAGAAGLVAWLRPEAIVLAAVLGAGRARQLASLRERALALALATAPFAAAATIRLATWGRPAPLSVLAKPSDLRHGFAYAVAGALLAGPVAVLAPWAWRRLDAWGRTLLAASLVHLATVAAAGGDWMPLSRLLVPALPAIVLVAARLLAASRWALVPVALAVAGEVFALAQVGPASARVLRDRLALVASARGPLAGARRTAAVDVGWVGAATEAPLFDLAGVTDPDVAALPGGHTSKAVALAMLEARGVDRLVLQLAPGATLDRPAYARIVEQRLSREPRFAEAFAIVAATPAELPIRYAILARRSPP